MKTQDAIQSSAHACLPSWWVSADVWTDFSGGFFAGGTKRIHALNESEAKHIYRTRVTRDLCGERVPFLQIINWHLCVPAD